MYSDIPQCTADFDLNKFETNPFLEKSLFVIKIGKSNLQKMNDLMFDNELYESIEMFSKYILLRKKNKL